MEIAEIGADVIDPIAVPGKNGIRSGCPGWKASMSPSIESPSAKLCWSAAGSRVASLPS